MAEGPRGSRNEGGDPAPTASRLDASTLAALTEPARLADLLWLALAIVLVIGTGLGVRMPWPADEPRFALIARDMVHSGDWLFPRVGGDLYPDKPPLYFWMLAAGYWLTGSIKASFLIPSFIAACTVAGLIYDLGRRLFGRVAGLAGALTLVFSIQFIMTMRGAQIDPTLCGLTTLSLYGLLRHLLLGPAWKWCFVGGLAAGLGVVTKGVGFLPLLVLLPYALFRARGFNGLPRFEGGARWGLIAIGFLLGVSVWLLPMVIGVATRNDPSLIAYRNEILFHQTVERYASAWHHVKPWYYFLVEVIPALWLPLSLLLFWLVPKWKLSLRERDARVWLPLAWVLLTTLFFSLSTGKRGIYLFPALPGVALAAARWLPELFQRKSIGRTSLALAGGVVIGGMLVLALQLRGDPRLIAIAGQYDAASLHISFMVFVALGATAWFVCAFKRPLLAWPAVLASLTVVVSYTLLPGIDWERSARTFMEKVLATVPAGTEFAVTGYKEQFLLYLDRPVVNFGHARWREGAQEGYDAAAWLNDAPDRVLLMPATGVDPCFKHTMKEPAGTSSGDEWLLVRGKADESCAARGHRERAITYRPPVFAAG